MTKNNMKIYKKRQEILVVIFVESRLLTIDFFLTNKV